jgi:hypothetical protein
MHINQKLPAYQYRVSARVPTALARTTYLNRMHAAPGLQQFLWSRPNCTNKKASAVVAYKTTGVGSRVAFENAGEKRKGFHWAMQEARKMQTTCTKLREMEECWNMVYAQALLVRAQRRGIDMPVAFG